MKPSDEKHPRSNIQQYSCSPSVHTVSLMMMKSSARNSSLFNGPSLVNVGMSQAWNFIFEGPRLLSLYKGDFHWKICGKLLKGHQWQDQSNGGHGLFGLCVLPGLDDLHIPRTIYTFTHQQLFFFILSYHN